MPGALAEAQSEGRTGRSPGRPRPPVPPRRPFCGEAETPRVAISGLGGCFPCLFLREPLRGLTPGSYPIRAPGSPASLLVDGVPGLWRRSFAVGPGRDGTERARGDESLAAFIFQVTAPRHLLCARVRGTTRPHHFGFVPQPGGLSSGTGAGCIHPDPGSRAAGPAILPVPGSPLLSLILPWLERAACLLVR